MEENGKDEGGRMKEMGKVGVGRRLLQGRGIVQQAIWLGKAEIGRRKVGRGMGLGAGAGARLLNCENGRLSHNWTPDWRDRFAKVERGKRKAVEETRRFGARGLWIERYPAVAARIFLRAKTEKRGFWLQKAKRRIAEVVAAKGVGVFRRGALCKNERPAFAKRKA